MLRYIRSCAAVGRGISAGVRLASVRQVSGSLYEPDYINVKPEVPVYDTLNISMKGYDFVVLESFAKYVHQMADQLDLDANAFPVPARTTFIKRYKPNSTQTESEFNLSMYERVVQIDDLNATKAPILIQLLQTNIPAGVTMSIKPVDEEEDKFRYVPDLTLMELQDQMAELDKIREDRKKKIRRLILNLNVHLDF